MVITDEDFFSNGSFKKRLQLSPNDFVLYSNDQSMTIRPRMEKSHNQLKQVCSKMCFSKKE